MFSRPVFYAFTMLLLSCTQTKKDTNEVTQKEPLKPNTGISLVVLGNVQDAGSPHIACKKDCCKSLFDSEDQSRKVVSLGLIDNLEQKTFLFEATPDMTYQLHSLKKSTDWATSDVPNGIFITHAHIGHYTGLMYLGKEATNAKDVPVYAMPKMSDFLSTNGPWSQLVSDKNIKLVAIENEQLLPLTNSIQVLPYKVPHRDEYSETVGFKVIGPNKSFLFIPDINKWNIWKTDIRSIIKEVDYAFLDATFFDAKEINNRDISEIPHPFVIESMSLFDSLSPQDKKKVYFIHFNHTNPLLDEHSEATKLVKEKGFSIARKDMKFTL